MKITYGREAYHCDSAKLKDGKLIIYQGGLPVVEITNIAHIDDYIVEGGAIEEDVTDDEALAIITGGITSREALSIIRGDNE